MVFLCINALDHNCTILHRISHHLFSVFQLNFNDLVFIDGNQLVLDLSYFIQDYWWAILVGLAATVVIVSNLWKCSPKFRELIDRGMLKAPIFGSIMHKSALARFARTTSTMFAAGVPMVEALDSVSGATGSIVIWQCGKRNAGRHCHWPITSSGNGAATIVSTYGQADGFHWRRIWSLG